MILILWLAVVPIQLNTLWLNMYFCLTSEYRRPCGVSRKKNWLVLKQARFLPWCPADAASDSRVCLIHRRQSVCRSLCFQTAQRLRSSVLGAERQPHVCCLFTVWSAARHANRWNSPSCPHMKQQHGCECNLTLRDPSWSLRKRPRRMQIWCGEERRSLTSAWVAWSWVASLPACLFLFLQRNPNMSVGVGGQSSPGHMLVWSLQMKMSVYMLGTRVFLLPVDVCHTESSPPPLPPPHSSGQNSIDVSQKKKCFKGETTFNITVTVHSRWGLMWGLTVAL